MATTSAPSALSRQYVKLCDLPDFDDPGLRACLRQIIAPVQDPVTELHRKYWEYAMLGLYLEEVGALTEDAEALAVGAGHEEPLFWVANRVGRMVATDIYGAGGFAYREADSSMLNDPRAFAPYPYREDHLEVRSMNALDLDFADSSFDIVFTLSSIEHFGGPNDIKRAASEMARVLRPGGHLVIVTECLIANHPLDWPALQFAIRLATLGRRCSTATPRHRLLDMFTPHELQRLIVEPTGLKLVQPLDTHVSPQSFDNLIHWGDDGSRRPATGNEFPHVLLQARGAPWTSVFLAFHQPS